MSAPLFYTGEDALSAARPGDLIVLDGEEGRHAADVRRIGPGEQVRLADRSGRVALARVTEASPGSLTLELVEISDEAPSGPRFVLVQALAKADRDLMAAEAATELGVDEVVPWQAERSIVRWRGERAAKAHRKWVNTVTAAAKQARRATVPTVPALLERRTLTERVAAAELALVLHEEASTPLATIELPTAGEVVLVVGPEGGISPAEFGAFTAAGAHPVRLGPEVLRTASAGMVALAALGAVTDRW